MMMQIAKPLQQFLGGIAIMGAMNHNLPAVAKGLEVTVGNLTPPLERDVFQAGRRLLADAGADAYRPLNHNERKVFSCLKLVERSVQFNGDASQATIDTAEVLHPEFTHWGAASYKEAFDDYRKRCREANTYDPHTGKLAGPPNFVRLGTETRNQNHH